MIAGETARFIKRDAYTWADVVIDGRDFGGSPVAGIPESLADAHGQGPHGARDACRAAFMRTSTYSTPNGRYEVDGYVLSDLSSKSAVLLVVSCPDGFRVGIAVGYFGDYGTPHEAVWMQFLQRSYPAGLGFLLDGSYSPERSAACWEESLTSLRTVVAAPDRWWSDAEDDFDVRSGATFVEGVLNGLPSVGATVRFFDGLRDHDSVPDCRAAGWRLTDEGERAWVVAADDGQWTYAHFAQFAVRDVPSRQWVADGWVALMALRERGWTLGAMRVLHSEEIVQDVCHTHVDSRLEPLSWEQVSGAGRWLEVTGSAGLASLCVEAGLGLGEVERMRAEGEVLDEGALRTLIALH